MASQQILSLFLLGKKSDFSQKAIKTKIYQRKLAYLDLAQEEN